MAPNPSRSFPGRRIASWRMGLVCCSLAACQPDLDIGARTCTEDGSPSEIPERTAVVDLPWSTGFENRLCDYTELAGFCYTGGSGAFEVVTAPVHSGAHALAFSVDTAREGEQQARCVRQGALPRSAYYGAWYFIPSTALNSGNWNLFHFTGGEDPSALAGVLDVSLINSGDTLRLAVYGLNHARIASSTVAPEVPIGRWFQIELYVERASGDAGRIALYQDGALVFDAKNVATNDSSLGQWYVGNWANALSPAASTLYVDDITLRASR